MSRILLLLGSLAGTIATRPMHEKLVRQQSFLEEISHGSGTRSSQEAALARAQQKTAKAVGAAEQAPESSTKLSYHELDLDEQEAHGVVQEPGSEAASTASVDHSDAGVKEKTPEQDRSPVQEKSRLEVKSQKVADAGKAAKHTSHQGTGTLAGFHQLDLAAEPELETKRNDPGRRDLYSYVRESGRRMKIKDMVLAWIACSVGILVLLGLLCCCHWQFSLLSVKPRK
mmetsp:Transcript_92595/g.220373  ORF Transcript_92595/g.220373 Transcript_92595/m.220373 type:complete len:228 (+) Transcript_92595:92-775(+)